MQAVQQWGLGICMAAVMAFLVEAIMPAGPLGRSLKSVCGLFVLLAVLAPARQAVLWQVQSQWPQQVEAFSPQSGQQLQQQLVAAQAQQQVRQVVLRELANAGIKPEQLIIHISLDGQQAQIEPVILTLSPQQQDRQQQAQEILQALGLSVQPAVAAPQGEDGHNE